MHAEAARLGARPSGTGFIQDADELNCEECEASYRLHYDEETGGPGILEHSGGRNHLGSPSASFRENSIGWAGVLNRRMANNPVTG